MATGPHWNVYGARSEMIRVPPASGPESASRTSTSLYLVSSPLPSRVSMVQFDITSHDQGWCSEPHEWSWTWFEVSILRPWRENTNNADFNQDGLTCTRSHPEEFGGVLQEIGYYFEEIPDEGGNRQSTSSGTVTSLPFIKNRVDWQWQHHSVSWGRHNDTGNGSYFLSLLEEGDRLAIWARAQFPGWVNFIKEVRISANTLNTHEDQYRLRNACNLEAATTHAEIAVHTNIGQETAIIYTQDPETAVLTGDQEVMSHENWSIHLSCQYDRFGNIDDLQAAINHAQKAVSATLTDHPKLPERLNNLSSRLFDRYGRFGNINDLQAAISYIQEAVATSPTDHPDWLVRLNSLSILLSRRYDHLGNIDDLQAAINYAQKAVSTTPTNISKLPGWLNNLSTLLSDRYNRVGNIDDLKAAIGYAQKVVDTTPTNHPDWPERLNNLSTCLSHQYNRFGNIDDLQAAIGHAQKAVATTPTDHINQGIYLNNLSNRLSGRYDRFGNINDLQSAISHAQKAVATTPTDHPDQGIYLNNLSTLLSRQYNRFGNIDDLQAAISHAQEAVASTQTNHPNLSAWLNSLSILLSNRYDRFRNIDDLQAAISYAQEAVAIIPTDHYDRPMRLGNLSNHLSYRYDHFGNIDDLQAAIGHGQEAVATTPTDHPGQGIYLNSLSNRLSNRYDHFGNISDLQAAISHVQKAVATTPTDHPDQGIYLNNLSCYLLRKHIRTEEAQVLRAALKLASMAANLSNAQPSQRMIAARRAIRIHATHAQWEDASVLATSALQFLPLICGRYLTRDDQQYAITQTTGFAADACSIFLRLSQPAQALQSLEFGRGLILGYLIDSRSDPEQLQIDHPHLAKEYNRLRFILSRPLDSVKSAGMEQIIELKQKAPRELDQCLATIRNQPGYERFLLEPAVDELVAQATEGPLVVVNITDFGSHAVIILDRDIYSLDLPALSTTAHFDLHQMVQHFRAVGQRGPQSSRDLQSEIDALGPSVQTARSYYDAESLSWLWEQCVEPILISIEDRIPDSTTLPRIWWIGTGVASSLPFHAAGIHGNSTQSAMDRSISSYTPTIKALAYSRSRLASKKPRDDQISVAIVAMPTTPQEQPLPGVQQEIDAIYQADPSVYNIQVQMHPNSEVVLQAIRETSIVHFACHGSCDPVDPSGSHLLLQNGSPSLPSVDQLTVRQISDQIVSQAYIAFLSACSTARVTAERFTDESIHLASAFQVAGFGHVIASLWSVDDAICATIARSFYRHLAQNSSRLASNRLVAEALHTAVLEIRMTERPSIWASFVHYGA